MKGLMCLSGCSFMLAIKLHYADSKGRYTTPAGNGRVTDIFRHAREAPVILDIERNTKKKLRALGIFSLRFDV